MQVSLKLISDIHIFIQMSYFGILDVKMSAYHELSDIDLANLLKKATRLHLMKSITGIGNHYMTRLILF